MATVTLTAFLPEVSPQVPGCPDITTTNAIRHSAIEFCERTAFWQETQDPVTVSSTDFPYDLEAPAGARVIQVMAVLIDGNPITPRHLDSLDSYDLDWRDSVGTPREYYQINPYQLGVYPALDTGDSVEMIMRVAYAPTRAASTIEEYVYQAHIETIAAGALYRLLAMPAVPWTNPDLSLFYRQRFQRGVTDAAIEANKTFGRAQLVVASRPFA